MTRKNHEKTSYQKYWTCQQNLLEMIVTFFWSNVIEFLRCCVSHNRSGTAHWSEPIHRASSYAGGGVLPSGTMGSYSNHCTANLRHRRRNLCF